MLGFWRLDIDGDFFLVAAPTWELSREIRAYHLELLARVRSLPHHHLIEADAVLFPQFAPYYQKISSRLSPAFDASQVLPHSRHSFFIAFEAYKDNWISGLEQLMGYEFKKESEASILAPSTGSFDLDVLAEALLLPNTTAIEYLVKTLTPSQLQALTKQVSDRLRGQEAIDELQRKQDLALFDQQQGIEQLKKAGFSI